jgi:hypothetical protein
MKNGYSSSFPENRHRESVCQPNQGECSGPLFALPLSQVGQLKLLEKQPVDILQVVPVTNVKRFP